MTQEELTAELIHLLRAVTTEESEALDFDLAMSIAVKRFYRAVHDAKVAHTAMSFSSSPLIGNTAQHPRPGR